MAKGKVKGKVSEIDYQSGDLKLRIVNAYNSGMNFGTAKQFSVSKSTIYHEKLR